MADQLSFTLEIARHRCDVMFASVAHHSEDERDKSERLQRELKAERARFPVCDTMTAKERSRTEDHDLKHRHRCQEQLLSLRKTMNRQAEKLQQEQELTAQKSADNDALRRELNEVKRAVELGEVRSKRKLAEVQAQIDADRSCWQNDVEKEKKKRQRIENSLKRAQKQSESRSFARQCELDLLKGDFCELEAELSGTHHDLRQAQSSLLLQSKSLAEKEHEISRLVKTVKALESSHEEEQQQLRNELTIAQSDTDLAKSTLATISDDYEGMRQKLDTMQKSIASFGADGGANPTSFAMRLTVNMASSLIVEFFCALIAWRGHCRAYPSN
ncbi:hypothetical protein LTR06_011034 [Exophiala xenobiotica]|nr:hypothetical protein LTR06_011034 [Exophiala xenobiotica]